MTDKAWKEYYFNYQKLLAEKYYIPLLNQLNIDISSKKILDVGCGDGGFITAFADAEAVATGLEIKDFNWSANPNIKFVIGNIIEEPEILKGNFFDIIILRDVIEHINKMDKYNFLNTISNLLTENGIILITFPPFNSPFGLHQQVFCKSILKYIPFLSLLPWWVLRPLFYLAGESKKSIKELYKINQSAMKISSFLKIIKNLNLIVKYSEYYLVRPSHEIRYDYKVRRTILGEIPILRELFVTGTVFVIKK